jgi:diadenylate cyclase
MENDGEEKIVVGELFVPQNENVSVEVEQKDFFDVLKMFAPGTSIRSALDDLLNAEMGALIVIDNGKVSPFVEKGFKIYSKFSPQKLVELAKMDGAIVLSKNVKKILYANTLLAPNPLISTRETGTRHKAAERTSKQTGAIIIAISERKRKMTLYYGDKRHELRKSSEVLRRASENMQILEKQRESLNEVLLDLNVLELQKMVTINDVSKVIQNFEVLKRISEVIKKHLIELGKEGMIVSSRLKSLTRGLDREEELVIRDYFGLKYIQIKDLFEKIDLDSLLETQDISDVLFEGVSDTKLSPKGIRILKKTNIPERYIDSLVAHFESLDKILSARYEDLFKIFQNEGMVDFFKEELYSLREKISLGKKI